MESCPQLLNAPAVMQAAVLLGVHLLRVDVPALLLTCRPSGQRRSSLTSRSSMDGGAGVQLFTASCCFPCMLLRQHSSSCAQWHCSSASRSRQEAFVHWQGYVRASCQKCVSSSCPTMVQACLLRARMRSWQG